VFKLARVGELKLIKQKALEPLVMKLTEVCESCLKLGGSYETEIKHLMAELRFQETWHFELFQKRLMAFKLGLLAIFFLPSYLGFIFLLIGDLVKQV